MDTKYLRKSLFAPVLAVAVLAGLGGMAFTGMGRASAGTTVAESGPPPPGLARATFAAGCFWSMEAIFKQLKGVVKVDPGYAGGTAASPSYEQVETGGTGYAEAANITYDPRVISYHELLRVLLIARDPTTLDSQGPDSGPQYRSVIFYRDAAQRREAEATIREVTAQHVWSNPIVAAVTPFTTFYRAEDYHLDYYRKHPAEGYCAFVIAPEIAHFRSVFKQDLK